MILCHITIVAFKKHFNREIRDARGNVQAWVGVDDLRHEGVFRLTDGTVASSLIVQWDNGEPNNAGNEDCVIWKSGDYLNDGHCTVKLRVLCQIPKYC